MWGPDGGSISSLNLLFAALRAVAWRGFCPLWGRYGGFGAAGGGSDSGTKLGDGSCLLGWM